MDEIKTKSVSQNLYEQACKILPGGISRNTIYRKPYPDYVSHGAGCRVTDVDGATRIDFSNNMAALIHGHAYPPIVEAVTKQLEKGTAFTLASESELRFAQHLCSRNDGFDKIRFVNSGTEAVMTAIKASRAIVGKPKIAKFEGSYHGTYDYAEVSQKAKPENWGDPNKPTSVPVADGTPSRALEDVVVLPYNDIERALSLLDQNSGELSCVLFDPLPHRIGLIPGSTAFVRALRDWTTQNDVLLVFDEVITFRMEYGGAQEWYDGVTPDLTSLGKIIGGGFPVGALAGKEEFMSCLDPTRPKVPFPHSGTFSANPITMTAGHIAMQYFDEKAVTELNRMGDYARKKITEAIGAAGVKACVTGAGSMFRLHLKEHPPVEYRTAYQELEESNQITRLVDYLYDHGFMMINTCTGALSTAITEIEIDYLAETLGAGLAELGSA